MVTQAEIDIVINARNMATAELTKLKSSLGSVGKEASGAASGMDHASKSAGGLTSSLGGIIKGAASVATGMLAVEGVKGIFAGVIGTAAGFEQALNGVSAATGATTDQMKAMRTEALKIGEDTSKGAGEAVEAMGELTKAGVSVDAVIGGVGRTVVQMAEASGSSVANMATLMSDSMNVFKIGAGDSAAAANTLVKAAGASSISIDDMAMSLSAGGLVFKSAGGDLEEFATAIGIMGNQGLKSSDAGTSLKAMIAGLTPTSKEAKAAFKEMNLELTDQRGNFKSFPDILSELSDGFAGMSEAQRAARAELLFGSDGIRAFNALIPDTAKGLGDAASQWGAFKEGAAGANDISEQSRRRLQGFSGALERLKGSLETIQIEVGSVVLPVLARMADALAVRLPAAFAVVRKAIADAKPVLDAFGADMAPRMQAFAAVLQGDVLPAARDFADVLHAIGDDVLAFVDRLGGLGPVLLAVGAAFGGLLIITTIAGAISGMVATVTGLVAAFTAMSAAISPVAAIVAILGGPLTLAIVGIGAAIAVLVLAWTQNWGDIQGKTQAVIAAIRPVLDALGDRLREFGALILPELAEAWASVSDKVGIAARAIQAAIEPVLNGVRAFLQAHGDEIRTILQGAWDAISVIVKTVLGILSNEIQFVLNVIQGDWDGAWQNVKNIVRIAWDGIKDLIQIAIDTIPVIVRLGMEATVVVLQAAWDLIKDTLIPGAWTAIKAAVQAGIDAIPVILRAGMDLATAALQLAWDFIKDTLIPLAWTGIKAAVSAGIDEVVTLLTGMKQKFLDALSDIGSWLWNAGWSLLHGMIEGAQSLGQEVVDAVTKPVKDAIAEIWKLIKPGSPSEEGRAMIVNLFQGMMAGAGEMGGALKAKMVSMAQEAFDALKKTVADAGGAILGPGVAPGGPLSLGGGGWVDQAINYAASRTGVPAALIAAIAATESQFGANQNGGTAFGLFQVEPRSHGGTPESWMGPEGAIRAVDEMAPRWASNFAALGGMAAYQADPVGFYQRYQSAAQGSIEISREQAEAAMRAARARGYAKGGKAPYGWGVVGEAGWERFHYGPDGLTIFPHDISKAMGPMAGGRGYQQGTIGFNTRDIVNGLMAAQISYGGATLGGTFEAGVLAAIIREIEQLNAALASGAVGMAEYEAGAQAIFSAFARINQIGYAAATVDTLADSLSAIPPLLTNEIQPSLGEVTGDIGKMTTEVGKIPPLISNGLLPVLSTTESQMDLVSGASGGMAKSLDAVGKTASTIAAGPFHDVDVAIQSLIDSFKAGMISAEDYDKAMQGLQATAAKIASPKGGGFAGASAIAQISGRAGGGSVPYGWFTSGEAGIELGHYGPDGLDIFSNAQSKAMLKGMGGAMRGFAGGSVGGNVGAIPGGSAGDNQLAEKYAAYIAGTHTQETIAAFFQGQQMMAEYVAAINQMLAEQDRQLEATRLGDEVKRFVAWVRQFGEEWLKQLLEAEGPTAAFQAFHGRSSRSLDPMLTPGPGQEVIVRRLESILVAVESLADRPVYVSPAEVGQAARDYETAYYRSRH